MKNIYKTVWEIKMKNVIDLAAGRGAFVDQSQVNCGDFNNTKSLFIKYSKVMVMVACRNSFSNLYSRNF